MVYSITCLRTELAGVIALKKPFNQFSIFKFLCSKFSILLCSNMTIVKERGC